MQEFEPLQETTPNRPAASPAPVAEAWEAEPPQAFAGPRRDAFGRTLDDALAHDRRLRERTLRRARQVVDGMRCCTTTRRVGLRIARGSWSPLLKFFHMLMPRTAEQCGLFVLGLLCCFGQLFFISGILASVGAAGSMLGFSLWLTATVIRTLLALYLRYLLPW